MHYTVEVTNRFKGLDLIHRVPEELWTEVRYIVQEAVINIMPKKKDAERQNGSEEALQIAVKRREVKSKGEKERYTHLNAEFQRIARRDKKAFLSDQCKEIEENNRMGKTNSVQFSRSVVSDSLQPHESQHVRPPCPSPTPGVHPDSRPSSQ